MEKVSIKSDINDILKEFYKTSLGINAKQNGYNDNDLLKMYTKKQMIEKIKTIKEDKIKSKNIDNMLKNNKQKYKDCWSWELI